MTRFQIRSITIIVSLLVVICGTGCQSTNRGGWFRGPRTTSTQQLNEFYEDELGGNEPGEIGLNGSTREFFQNNRLPGGLSAEARSIERGSFNVH